MEFTLEIWDKYHLTFRDSVDSLPLTEIPSQKCLITKNAGGKSEISEAYSIEYMMTRLHARDVLLEMQVEYIFRYKMVDYICSISEKEPRQSRGSDTQCPRVGVSVTRAFPYYGTFTEDDAAILLKKKLYGLIVSRNCVSEKLSFYKSILHIWCPTQEIANHLQKVYRSFDLNDFGLDVQNTLVLLVTVCDEKEIYYNKFS